MAIGPVDVYIIGFPGNKFSGRIAPAIMELVENGTIRILDLLFVMKDADGVVTTVAAANLDEDGARLPPHRRHAAGCTRTRGCRGGRRRPSGQQLGAPGCVREPLGSRRMVDALQAADAVVIDSIRIPADVVEAALDGRLEHRHYELERTRHGTSTYGSPHRGRRGNRHRRVRARAASSGQQVGPAGRSSSTSSNKRRTRQAPPPGLRTTRRHSSRTSRSFTPRACSPTRSSRPPRPRSSESDRDRTDASRETGRGLLAAGRGLRRDRRRPLPRPLGLVPPRALERRPGGRAVTCSICAAAPASSPAS